MNEREVLKRLDFIYASIQTDEFLSLLSRNLVCSKIREYACSLNNRISTIALSLLAFKKEKLAFKTMRGEYSPILPGNVVLVDFDQKGYKRGNLQLYYANSYLSRELIERINIEKGGLAGTHCLSCEYMRCQIARANLTAMKNTYYLFDETAQSNIDRDTLLRYKRDFLSRNSSLYLLCPKLFVAENIISTTNDGIFAVALSAAVSFQEILESIGVKKTEFTHTIYPDMIDFADLGLDLEESIKTTKPINIRIPVYHIGDFCVVIIPYPRPHTRIFAIADFLSRELNKDVYAVLMSPEAPISVVSRSSIPGYGDALRHDIRDPNFYFPNIYCLYCLRCEGITKMLVQGYHPHEREVHSFPQSFALEYNVKKLRIETDVTVSTPNPDDIFKLADSQHYGLTQRDLEELREFLKNYGKRGRKKIKGFIDTGSQETILNESIMIELGLQPFAKSLIGGIGGTITTRYYIANISIDYGKEKTMVVGTLPSAFDGYDALIGLDYFDDEEELKTILGKMKRK